MQNDYKNMKAVTDNNDMTAAFKTIYKILNRLEKSLDVDKEAHRDFKAIDEIGHEALDISYPRWKEYITMLRDAGYIDGVRIKSFIDGTTSVDISEIHITLQGMQYLAENTMMSRIYNTIKGVKDRYY